MFTDRAHSPLRSAARLTLVLGALSASWGCDNDYVAPPEASLTLPEGGNYVVGEPLELTFSEPIVPASLKVSVWPNDIDQENELIAGTEPHISGCTLDTSPCGDMSMALSDDGLTLLLSFDVEGLGRPEIPLLLEIGEGLEGTVGGRSAGAAQWFSFLFKPDFDEENVDPVEFTNGRYLIVGTINEPLPATLRLMTELIVLEDGRMAAAGGEVNPIDGAARNTSNPEEVFIDESDEGFAIFTLGRVLNKDGERLFETEPIEVNVKIGPVQVILSGVRLTGAVVANPDQPGSDMLDGRLTFEALTLISGRIETDYPGGGTTFVGPYVPEALVPAGSPEVCGELCNGVTAQCEPPDDFPGPDFCP